MSPPSVANFAACTGFSGRFIPSGIWIATLLPSDLVILSSPDPLLLFALTTIAPSENEIELMSKKKRIQMKEWFCRTGMLTLRK